jgi:hypothetical protein
MLALVDRGPSGDGDGPPAVPAVYRGTEGRPGPVLFTLDVDGEWFAIREAGDGGTAYDWLSGPNKGYGFASSGTPNRSVEPLPDTDIGMSASSNWHYRSIVAGASRRSVSGIAGVHGNAPGTSWRCAPGQQVRARPRHSRVCCDRMRG